MKRSYCALIAGLSLAAFWPSTSAHARQHGIPAATPAPAVISFSVIRADDGARFIHRFYPHVHIVVDHEANAIIVSATSDELNGIRQIAGGIDSKSPLARVAQSIALHRLGAVDVAQRLQGLYPGARFTVLGRRTLLVSSNSADLQQMQTLVSAIDAPPATPTPAPLPTPPDTEAVHVFQAPARQVARQVAGAVHGIRVSVAGQAVVLAGTPDLVSRAKDIIAVLDAPPASQRYTAVYRIHTLDAQSVGDLIQRSFTDAKVSVDEDINSISVLATASEQRRIADAVDRLDSQGPSPGAAAGQPGAANVAGGAGSVQVYTMKAALPGSNNAPSTSATDMATLVTQALQSQAPDLHINVAQDAPQMILTGSPYSIKLAKDLLAQLDVSQKLVVLDTEILEVDENTAKNLGIAVTSITGGPFSVGTIFAEASPQPDPSTGLTPMLRRFQPFYRTPIAFGVAVNLAIQHGNARVLADPRITTLSGHTATIRAGDNISIPLTTGGGAGTIATTQIQTFQTGVTLDITPIVNAEGLITVALHPVVNSLTGILNGVPQISTRDTQTTVALKEDETLVIGGLIQDNTQRTESRIPVLGDLPLVGNVFRNQTLNGDRNELIISVTPHIVTPGQNSIYPGPPLPSIPTPAPLPTLPPGTVLPASAPTPIMTPEPTPARKLPVPVNMPSPLPVATTTPSPSSPANTFTYGSQPASNAATARDAPRIYYVTLSPTTLSYGTAVQISAITSSNVSQLTLSYNGVAISVGQTGAGQWQAAFPFTLVGEPVPAGTVTLTLIASKPDGTSTSLPIPVTLAPRGGVTSSRARSAGRTRAISPLAGYTGPVRRRAIACRAGSVRSRPSLADS